jgi:ABC-type bacteriocin/lantibiotic exporter with double-glycine peptidase domain
MTGLFGKAVFISHLHVVRATQLVQAEVRRMKQAGAAWSGAFLHQLLPGVSKHLPLLYQSQPGESGLTCMAMMANYHRCSFELPAVRHWLALPARDLNLAQLVRVAGKMSMSCRPRRVNAARLPDVRTPVILRWHKDHYVVLKRVQGQQLILHDPATGCITVSFEQAMNAFSGIVLECEPLSEFGKYTQSWVR